MDDDIEPLGRVIKSLNEDLHLARRANRIAAIVTDTSRQNFEDLAQERGDQVVPVGVVLELLDGILAALAGKTDWSELRCIHPDVTPLAYARIQVLLDGPGH